MSLVLRFRHRYLPETGYHVSDINGSYKVRHIYIFKVLYLLCRCTRNRFFCAFLLYMSLPFCQTNNVTVREFPSHAEAPEDTSQGMVTAFYVRASEFKTRSNHVSNYIELPTNARPNSYLSADWLNVCHFPV